MRKRKQENLETKFERNKELKGEKKKQKNQSPIKKLIINNLSLVVNNGRHL